MLEQKNQGRARFKLAVFCVIGVHVVGLMALLLTQGCKRDPAQSVGEVQPPLVDANTNLPSMDNTNDLAYSNAYAMPSNTYVEPTPPAQATTEHTIVKGDTFYDLAKKYGVTMKALTDANPTVNPSKLQLGQKIVVPAPVAAAPTATGGAAPLIPETATGEITYEVKSGDNLTKIAEKYKVTIAAIRTANNLTSDRIVVGQKLKIPAKTPAQ